MRTARIEPATLEHIQRLGSTANGLVLAATSVSARNWAPAGWQTHHESPWTLAKLASAIEPGAYKHQGVFNIVISGDTSTITRYDPILKSLEENAGTNVWLCTEDLRTLPAAILSRAAETLDIAAHVDPNDPVDVWTAGDALLAADLDPEAVETVLSSTDWDELSQALETLGDLKTGLKGWIRVNIRRWETAQVTTLAEAERLSANIGAASVALERLKLNLNTKAVGYTLTRQLH